MKNIYGIKLCFSKAKPGLWYDTENYEYDPSGYGVLVQILCGSFARPVKKFWTNENPWQAQAWFTLRLPFIILPYISVAIGRYGFYLGGKAFTVDSDEPWARPEEYGKRKLTISATIRRTRDM